MTEKTGLITGEDGKTRCWWPGEDAEYLRYHDEEWGRPVGDDNRLFEKLCLEGFQSGLSWITILRKRENFRAAFAGFDPVKVSKFTEADVERLLRINRTLEKIPPHIREAEGMELKSIDLLEINPSRPLDQMAGEFVHEIPRAIKMIFGGSGNTSQSGSGILSYLLFSEGFCKALIDLGYHDAMERVDEIKDFFADHFVGAEGTETDQENNVQRNTA